MRIEYGKCMSFPAPEPAFATGLGPEDSDAVLLGRFVDHWDHGAFRDLVGRHGPMVLGVCRRILRSEHAAEDAFQATFLLLVRKAGSVRKRESVGPWLFGVAQRVAIEARRGAARRPTVVPLAPDASASSTGDPDAVERDELQAAVHEELGRLPEKFRDPLVLCYLEGLPQEVVACRLGWPIGTVRGRIARGRDLLGARLIRRGLKPAAVLLALSLLPKRAGAAPVALVDATVRAAAQVAAGEVANRGEVSVRVADLERKVRKAMQLSGLKWIAMTALTAIMVGATLTGVVPRVIAGADETARVEAEKKKLQGSWEILTAEESGKKPDDDTSAVRLKIEGDSFALVNGETIMAKGPFKLDPSKEPMEMDIAFQEGKMAGKTGLAIYAWDGANLKFCGREDRHGRPTDFTTTPGDERLLLLLKRQAP
jgi:RNA polymerase sigma factor (sigma-70 family)